MHVKGCHYQHTYPRRHISQYLARIIHNHIQARIMHAHKCAKCLERAEVAKIEPVDVQARREGSRIRLGGELCIRKAHMNSSTESDELIQSNDAHHISRVVDCEAEVDMCWTGPFPHTR